MEIQIGLAIFTAVSTVIVILCTVVVVRARGELRSAIHSMRKQATTYDLMCEEFDALKRRQSKLAGRFDRERKPPMVVDGAEFERDELPPRDDRTVDFVNGAGDAEWQAMLALQRAQSPG